MSYVRNAERKLSVLLLQNAIAEQVSREAQLAPGAPDEDRILAALVMLKRRLVSATSADTPSDAPVFFSGIGFCDQVNGAAALVLARSFARSETFNVWKRDESWGHTIGRVWSDQHHEWLYYDMFYPDLAVFRIDAQSHVV